MRIGELAKRSDCKVRTVRCYEKEGLLPSPSRTRAGYRIYTEKDLDRLGFIARGCGLGFGLADIRELIGLEENPDLSSGDVERITRHHRDQVRSKIRQLQNLDAVLERLLADSGVGMRTQCEILRTLHRKVGDALSRVAPSSS
jgi:MerR family mercuric resistance operon transcriptional regulator